MALMSYGSIMGIERQRSETMGNLSAYLQRVGDHLIHSGNVTYTDDVE